MNNTSTVTSFVRASDILITSEFLGRPDRPSRPEAELAAFRELAMLMAEDAARAVHRFLQLAIELCEAGSAGVSLLRPDDTGTLVFYWDALAGAFAPFQGGSTPRHHSPCGLCLDAAGPVVVSRPARLFTYFNDASPAIVESLIVPLYDNARHALGTLWVVHHDDTRRFSPNDLRVMEELASQLVLALKLAEERKAALLASENFLERDRRVNTLLEQVNAKDVLISEVNHRVKNTIQSALSLLSVQAKTSQSSEARDVLYEAQSRLHVLMKVHELLYQSAKDVQDVAIRPLLESLANALKDSHGPTHSHIQLKLEICGATLSADHAIPLALLVNELITNAYKHAFPNEREGEISVRLSEPNEGGFVLQVRDNGIGLSMSPIGNTLGMRLVQSFAAQLKGSLDIETKAGTCATISIP